MNKNLIGAIVISAALITGIVLMSSNVLSKESPDTVTLTAGNTLNLSAEVDGESVGAVIKQAKGLKGKNSDPIYLFLNTPGGDIQAGLELIEALKGLERPVNTVTLFAASMGFQIAQNMNERLIVKNGTLMSHRARGKVGGEFGGQNPSQLDNRINFWKSRIEEMDQTTVNKTKGKQTLKSYQAQYANELWMSGIQSVEQGYADRVVTVKCDKSLDGVTSHVVSFLGMSISYDLDNCPINTSPSNVRMKLETTRGLLDSEEFIHLGGHFGPACLVSTDVNKLCTLDTTLTPNKVDDIRHDFVSKYNTNHQKVIYMTLDY